MHDHSTCPICLHEVFDGLEWLPSEGRHTMRSQTSLILFWARNGREGWLGLDFKLCGKHHAFRGDVTHTQGYPPPTLATRHQMTFVKMLALLCMEVIDPGSWLRTASGRASCIGRLLRRAHLTRCASACGDQRDSFASQN